MIRRGRSFVRVVTIIDRLPIAIFDGCSGLHTAQVHRWPLLSALRSCSSFRFLLSLGSGTGNALLISLRPLLKSPLEPTLVQWAVRRGIVEHGDHLNFERLTIEKEACPEVSDV